MDTFNDVGADRLLALADILDEADAKHAAKGGPRFTMRTWFHHCGTPACAMGHWAASEDAATRGWGWNASKGDIQCPSVGNLGNEIQKEFGINHLEVDKLFSGAGCGGARTGKEAAIYIRNFVHEKLSCGTGG